MKPFKLWTSAQAIAFMRSVDKRTWGIVLLIAGVFFLVVVFLIIPAWIERPLLRRDIQNMELQIRQINSLSQKRPGWEKNEALWGSLIGKTQTRVFTGEDVGLLLGQVSKMAVESGVDVLASRPSAEKVIFSAPYNAKYQPNGYEFTVQGGFHDLAELTSRIETHDKLLCIRGIEIVPAEKNSTKQVAELKLWAILVPAKSTVPAAGVGSAQK